MGRRKRGKNNKSLRETMQIVNAIDSALQSDQKQNTYTSTPIYTGGMVSYEGNKTPEIVDTSKRIRGILSGYERNEPLLDDDIGKLTTLIFKHDATIPTAYLAQCPEKEFQMALIKTVEDAVGKDRPSIFYNDLDAAISRTAALLKEDPENKLLLDRAEYLKIHRDYCVTKRPPKEKGKGYTYTWNTDTDFYIGLRQNDIKEIEAETTTPANDTSISLEELSDIEIVRHLIEKIEQDPDNPDKMGGYINNLVDNLTELGNHNLANYLKFDKEDLFKLDSFTVILDWRTSSERSIEILQHRIDRINRDNDRLNDLDF